jgi:hypothetical protein
MSYASIMQRLLGVACLLGPALYLLAALAYTTGNLALEAMLGMYAWTIFIALYQGVGQVIGRRLPVYGAVVAGLGFFMTAGVVAYAMRMTGHALTINGAFVDQDQAFDLVQSVPAFVAFGILGLLGPVLPIVSAMGLLRARAVPVWAAAALVAGGIAFFAAQVLTLAYSITYPLYVLLLLTGFAPVAMRLLRSEAAPAAATQPAAA